MSKAGTYDPVGHYITRKSSIPGPNMLFICVLFLLVVSASSQSVCHLGKDLALVFDIAAGKTEQEHKDVVSFGRKLVNLLHDELLTQLAIISYDTEARMRVSLKEWSSSDAKAQIFNLFTAWDASTTQTHRAMRCLNDQAFSVDYGDRPDAPNVAFVVTDRVSSDPAEAKRRANILKDGGTTVFIINIASAMSATQALDYATNADSVWNVVSYTELVQNFETFKDMNFRCVLRNVALGGQASQSSLLWEGLPGRAIDGNASSHWSQESCTHTDLTSKPWWRVDMGKVYLIERIQITNRQDCCDYRLSNFNVSSSLSVGGPYTYEYTRLSAVPAGGTANFIIDPAVYARYVTVQLNGVNYLTLCEVEVYGLST